MKHIYFTTCAEDGGIYHYTFQNEKLTLCQKLSLDRPMYTVIKNDTAYILLRDLNNVDGFGGIITCSIDSTGKLINLSDPLSTHGIVPCHLCVIDKDVYVVNYLSGNIVKMPDVIVTHSGKGIDPTRQAEPHTHFVTASPDGKYILCTDLGIDTIFVYDRNLNEISNTKVPNGSGCRHLCFSKNGQYVYCVNELFSDVSVFTLNDGILSLQDTYKAIPDFKAVSTAAAIRIHDNYLYVSHRGADCISCFKVDGKHLTLLENRPCGGKSPRDFDVLDGYMFCANEGGNISVLKLIAGKPLLTDSIDLAEAPLCVTFYDDGGDSDE